MDSANDEKKLGEPLEQEGEAKDVMMSTSARSLASSQRVRALTAAVGSGRRLRDVAIRRGDLAKADLRGLRADRVDFRAADLRGARLQEARLSACSLEDARLEGSAWQGATVRMCSLEGAQGPAARFDGARLEDSSARGVDLTGAVLNGAMLSETSFARAVLRNAGLRGVRGSGVEFRGADLRSADLRGSCLDEADFRGADLSGADLSRGRFDGADFRGAVLEGTLFGGAECRGALFDEDAGPAPKGDAAAGTGRETPDGALGASLAEGLPAALGGGSAAAEASEPLKRSLEAFDKAVSESPEELRRWAEALLVAVQGESLDVKTLVETLVDGPGELAGLASQSGASKQDVARHLRGLIEALEEGAAEPPEEWRPLLEPLLKMKKGRALDAATLIEALGNAGKTGSKPQSGTGERR